MRLRGYTTGESISIKPPSAPTANATVTLFDSYVMFGPRQLRQMNGTLLEITFEALNQDSATNGLIAYTQIHSDVAATTSYVQNNLKNDAGTDTLPVQVTSASVQNSYRFVISPYAEFKLTFTAGNTAPTTWSVGITLQTGQLSIGR